MRPRAYDFRSFCRILWDNGYNEVKITGGHHKFENDVGNVIVITKKLNKMVALRLIKENNLVVS